MIEKLHLVNEQAETAVLYGAGGGLETYRKHWESKGVCPVCICDTDISKQGTVIDNLSILSLKQCLNQYQNVHFYLTVLDSKNRDSIIQNLTSQGVTQDHVHIWAMNDPNELRRFCADYHINSMGEYFDSAEQAQSIQTFWGKDTTFFEYFQMLSLENVIELACGRGRHVPQYIAQADNVVLVDILDENIAYCKQRFEGFQNISYYVNSGSDLTQLPDNMFTALFTYDAMVHFESIDVYYYLQETFRVLQQGGRALFHHSNNTYDYKQSFVNSIGGGRNYMSAQLFAHYAHRAGLTVLEQKTIDWGIPNLDCITLVEKK